MTKYVVSTSDYMGDEPDMYMVDAKDDWDAVIAVFPDDYDEMENGMTKEDYIKWQCESNGDGQPYYQILNTKTGEVIFG